MSFMAGYLLGRSQAKKPKLQKLEVFSDEKKTYLPEEDFDGFGAVEVDITASKPMMDRIVGYQKLGDLQLTDRYRVEARLGKHISRKIYIWYNVSGEIPFARRRDEYDTLFSVVYRDNIPVAAFAHTEMLEKSYDLQTGKCYRHTYENIGISERSGNNRWNVKYHHNDDTGFSADEWQLYISLMPWSETRTLYTVLSMEELTELADDFYKNAVWGQ